MKARFVIKIAWEADDHDVNRRAGESLYRELQEKLPDVMAGFSKIKSCFIAWESIDESETTE